MEHPLSEEATLVSRAAGGDEAAFEALVLAWQERVWRLLVRMLGSPIDARDVAQETFLAAWRGLPCFRDGEQFGPWLMTIATRRCLNHLRGRQRSRTDLVDDLERYASAPDVHDPQEQVLARENRDTVREAVGLLPAVARAVVVLHYTEGCSCGRIGQILEMSESAVKVALFRARGRLREMLKGGGEREV